jgi:hypothetical protein
MADLAEWIVGLARFELVTATVLDWETSVVTDANPDYIWQYITRKQLTTVEDDVNDALIESAVIWEDGSITITLNEEASWDTEVYVIVAIID